MRLNFYCMKKRFAPYKILLNGKIFLHSLTKKEGEKFLNNMSGTKSKIIKCGEVKEVTSPLGKFELIKDRWVLFYHDSVWDQSGESYHILIKEIDGTVISSVSGGYWTSEIPDASGSTPRIDSAAFHNL